MSGTTSVEQGHNARKTAEEQKNVAAYAAEMKVIEKQLRVQTGLLADARKILRKAEEAVDRANAETVTPAENISLADIQKLVQANNPVPTGKHFLAKLP